MKITNNNPEFKIAVASDEFDPQNAEIDFRIDAARCVPEQAEKFVYAFQAAIQIAREINTGMVPNIIEIQKKYSKNL